MAVLPTPNRQGAGASFVAGERLHSLVPHPPPQYLWQFVWFSLNPSLEVCVGGVCGKEAG